MTTLLTITLFTVIIFGISAYLLHSDKDWVESIGVVGISISIVSIICTIGVSIGEPIGDNEVAIRYECVEFATETCILAVPLNGDIEPMVTRNMKFLGKELEIIETRQYNAWGIEKKTLRSYEISTVKDN